MTRFVFLFVALLMISGCMFGGKDEGTEKAPVIPEVSHPSDLDDFGSVPAELLVEEFSSERSKRMYVIEILKTTGEQPFYWRVKAKNGQILLTSEKYVNSPIRIVENFSQAFKPRHCRIEDLTK